ncbi:alginate O-acetyltransferase AlgX-related protein [Cryobacterium adonitolivorans]|uniref:alginate O-acetyltransferase AlgX-related protein n=1 Tax=Cryobacterium adonitolivorans TaxID=1259189 RepID=UPI00141ADFFC|nr:hypothetical protein [Cryobacterium adonitolivorans]
MSNADETATDTDDSRDWHRWASTALIGAFSVGLLAIWLVPGDTAGAENRTRLPWPTVTAASAGDAATYRGIDAALRDRLGAQATVSEALGDLSVHGLGRSPTSTVLIGSNREPFFVEDLARPCRETEDSLAAVKAGLVQDQAAMAAAGKYVLFMVAPDKTSIRRAPVTDVSPDLLRCSDFVRGHVEGWESEGNLPLVTLWDDVAARDTAAAPAYLRNDTHWSAHGSMALSEALMQRLVDDRQVPAGILDDLTNPVSSDPIPYVGDLNHMMGVEDIDHKTTISFDRPDVVTKARTTVGAAGTPEYHYRSTSTSSPLVPGKTLLIGDSFLLHQIPTQLSNFFEDVTMTDLEEWAQAGEYDTVIVVRVERYSATGEWPSLTATLK